MLKTIALLLTLAAAAAAQDAPTVAFQFAVSGDSRNCGDIVMPAIAAKVLATPARFYWHLGDFRAIYTFDEDLSPPPDTGLKPAPLTISGYESTAWPDFIRRQLTPFGALPVYLAIGNHEAIPPMSRDLYIAQFADWINSDAIRTQRLRAGWSRLVLWPAFVVIVFGLLQALVLPNDFLRHFGYGHATIMPMETINNNKAYIRVMSTLRGANALPAQ